MIFENVTSKTKVLTCKVGKDEFKIHLRAPSFRQEQFIIAIDGRTPLTQEEADYRLAEFVSRLIRSVVTKVEGIQIRNEKDEITDFVVETKDDMMTEECYTVMMRILNHCPEAIKQMQEYYTECVDIKAVETKKPKASKKKK